MLISSSFPLSFDISVVFPDPSYPRKFADGRFQKQKLKINEGKKLTENEPSRTIDLLEGSFLLAELETSLKMDDLPKRNTGRRSLLQRNNA